MYLEVTNFGDEKTLFYLEKVILWLYNFTRGFYSQKTDISCEDNNWLVPPPPIWFKCLCLRLKHGPKIQTRGLCWIFTFSSPGWYCIKFAKGT